MLNLYGILEIDKILEEISSLSNSEVAKEKILNLKMIKDIDEFQHATDLLAESIEILNYYDIKDNYSSRLDILFEKGKKGKMLSLGELDQVRTDIKSTLQLISSFAKVKFIDGSKLKKLLYNFFDLASLKKEIDAIINEDLSIKDDASDELYSLRKSIKKIEEKSRIEAEKVLNKYSPYLSEKVITIRDGHFVLPLLNQYKNKVLGIVYDISDSGLTSFVEPSELIDIYNDLQVVLLKEKEEIHRLIVSLSKKILENEKKLISNNLLLGEISFHLAKARYALKHNYIVGKLSDDHSIKLKSASHPLIDPKIVVSNDYYFDRENKIIILSGPNAGGKSVALKTLGIISLMFLMGLPVSAYDAKIPFFKHIYVDIGDQQSLSDNLSTFSAHIDNLARITRHCEENDLVILDELGSATSPSEGSAIAMAIIDYLRKKNCFAFISSHYESLKEYAYKNSGVKNAMMIFDETNFLPSYKLKIGLPGKSYGIYMAKRYHLKGEIIYNAEKYLAKNSHNEISDLLKNLNDEVAKYQTLNEEVIRRNKELEIKQLQIATIENKLRERNEDIKSNAEKIIAKEVQKAKEHIDKILKNQQMDVSLPTAIKAKNALNKLLAKNEKDDLENKICDDNISLGDYVSLSDYQIEGKVIKVNGNNLLIRTNNGLDVKTTIDKITKIAAPQITKNIDFYVDKNIRYDRQVELNIIGLRYDEAMRKVEKFLDDALLNKFSNVAIIHGHGSGALKRGVREYLSKCSFVKSFEDALANNGGSGKTIIYLK